MRIKYLVFSLIIAFPFLSIYTHADDLSKDFFVSDAWVQAVPPSQTTTAAYMVITNNSKKEAVLVSASSDIAGTTEIHQMSDKNGMMRMAMVPHVHLPARGTMIFQPSGFHFMMIDLKKPVNKGDIITMTLHFQDGRVIVVKAQVKLTQDEETGHISSSMPGMKM